MLNEKQVNDYLNLIGWFESHDDAPRHTVADLDALVWLHQTHVPFANADAHLAHKAADLDENALFDKIVTKRRGGICYELNAAFHGLLIGLSFDAIPVFARNVRNIPADSPAPISHRSELVRLDGGLRYVDVGYGGPMAGCSMVVEPGSKTLSAGRWFLIDRAAEEGWWQISFASASRCTKLEMAPATETLTRQAPTSKTPASGATPANARKTPDSGVIPDRATPASGAIPASAASASTTSTNADPAISAPPDEAFEPVLLFHDRAAREDDFVPLCWYTTMCPDSVFVRLMFLNLRTETGNISVRGNVHTTVDGTEHHSAEITKDEMLALAKNVFGLNLEQ